MRKRANSNMTVLPAPVGAVMTTFLSVSYKSRKATVCAMLKCENGNMRRSGDAGRYGWSIAVS